MLTKRRTTYSHHEIIVGANPAALSQHAATSRGAWTARETAAWTPSACRHARAVDRSASPTPNGGGVQPSPWCESLGTRRAYRLVRPSARGDHAVEPFAAR